MNNKNGHQIKLKGLFFTCVFIASLSVTSMAQTRANANVGGFESGSKIPKSTFVTLPGVGVYIKEAPFEIKYTVLSFTVKLVDDENGVKEVSCQGSAFSALAKKYINDYAQPGDIISIQNIRVKDEGGQEKKLPALLYIIQ